MIIRAGAKLWNFLFKIGPITTDNAKGFCQDPKTKGKEIVVKIGLTPLMELDTICHEVGGHACQWSLDEEYVNRNASELARVLWRLGYRLAVEGEEMSCHRCFQCGKKCEPIRHPKHASVMLCKKCVKILAENAGWNIDA